MFERHTRSTLALAIMMTVVALPVAAGGAKIDQDAHSEASFDQFIVRYRDGSPQKASVAKLKASLNQAAVSVPSGKAFGLSHKRKMALGMDVINSSRPLDRTEADALMRRLAADPNVEHVEIDLEMRAFVPPNDTRYADQWHYYEETGGFNLPIAWDRSTGAGVVVAVVDSGILAHPDLNDNILPGYDFISKASRANNKTRGSSNDGNGRDNDPTDSSNVVHGTHVAGTIAAVTNNASGVAGVAYDARVVPLRVLGRDGFGSTSDIADAIVWASGGDVAGVPANANPAEIINLSLGGESACTAGSAYQLAVNEAVGNGSTVVVAAGNENHDVSGFTPAGCNNVIAVAAGDRGGNRAWYSNYGATIDVTAPGGETQSCTKSEFLPLAVYPNQLTVENCQSLRSHPERGILSTIEAGGYGFYDGTSMAAPHVAGVAALMQAAARVPLTPAQVEATLRDTTRAIPAANCPGGCGAGFVDADAAVSAAAAR